MTAVRIPIPRLADGRIDRTAWLEARLPYYNASSAALLYGLDFYGRTLADEAVKKITCDVADNGTDAMKRGHYLEPALSAFLSDELGIEITEPTCMYACDSVAMTPDGEFVGSDTDLPEFKSSNEWGYGDPFPLMWRLQAVAQCVARPSLERVHFSVLDRWLRFSHHVIEPEQWEKDDLARRASDFMAWISMGLVPDDLPLSYDNVLRLYPPAEPEASVDVDEGGLGVLRGWDTARRLRIEAEANERVARDEVARLLLDASVARFDGQPVATWRQDKRGARTLRAAKALWAPEGVAV